MPGLRAGNPGWALLGLLLCVVSGSAAGAQPRPLGGLDAYVERGMRTWEVPGLALAVVRGDSVVYARGYGVRELGRPERVDPSTLFAIGSASKAFTSAALGMLVDEGRMGWDDPATRHLPGFQLFDPYVTREMTVRDLLTHRSGLARGDLLWYASDLDRADILRQVRYLEPTWSFRSSFGYQNIMYLAAGEIVPSITGTTWDRFVEQRIFAPLGMERSSTSVDPLPGMENVATPHASVDGGVRPISYRDIDNIAPAGSINSSALEMARWVALHLNHGRYRGQRLLSEEAVREMHEPQTIIRREGAWAVMSPESHFLAYGLGWFLHDYRGRKVVQHGGNIDGMHALVAMLPEEDVGLVILTNYPNSLTTALAHRVFDAYLGAPARDWSTELKAKTDSLRAIGAAQQRAMEEARVAGTSPSLPLERYVGTYRDEMYGDAEVALENGRLVLRRGSRFAGDLEHWHYDTFRVIWRDPAMGRAFVSFSLDARGRSAELEVQGLTEFQRVVDGAAPTR